MTTWTYNKPPLCPNWLWGRIYTYCMSFTKTIDVDGQRIVFKGNAEFTGKNKSKIGELNG